MFPDELVSNEERTSERRRGRQKRTITTPGHGLEFHINKASTNKVDSNKGNTLLVLGIGATPGR